MRQVGLNNGKYFFKLISQFGEYFINRSSPIARNRRPASSQAAFSNFVTFALTLSSFESTFITGSILQLLEI
jgi:hypothetical protein